MKNTYTFTKEICYTKNTNKERGHTMGSAHKVYFDYIYDAKNNNVILGVHILDGDGDVIHEIFTKTIKGQGPVNKNNLIYSTQAFNYAITISQQNFLEDVIFVNQNEVIFNWVMDDAETSREYVNQARASMVKYLVEYEAKALYDYSIKGKQNLAKKELTRIQKKLLTSRAKQKDEGMGSFNDLLKSKAGSSTTTTTTTTKRYKGEPTSNSKVSTLFKGTPTKPARSGRLGYSSTLTKGEE